MSYDSATLCPLKCLSQGASGGWWRSEAWSARSAWRYAKVGCCGRPLYDFGMLTLAKRQLRQILEALRAYITEGVLIVGLEPS